MARTPKEQYDDMTEFKQVEIKFDKIRVQGGKYFGKEELANMRLEEIPVRMNDVILLQWSTMCRGEKLREDRKEVAFTYPANWLEHLKYAKHFPKWLKKKYPIKYKTYTQTVIFKEVAVFPKISNYINFHGNDSAYFLHTEINNANKYYDCNMNIMDKK